MHSSNILIFSTLWTSHNMFKTPLNSFASTNYIPQTRPNFVNQTWTTTLSSMHCLEFSKSSTSLL